MQNEPLSRHTTFKIGGQAKFFAIVDDEQKLIELLRGAASENLQVFYIGEGSNLLVADNGFDGLVVKLNFNQVEFNGDKVTVSADYLLKRLVPLCASHNLTGLEFSAGIPGSVGGAVVGNAGAYGGEMSQIVESAEVLDDIFNKRYLKNADFNFSYRNSLLKSKDWLLLRTVLKLKIGSREESLTIINKHVSDRWQKHPHEPSAGSTFKNVQLTDEIQQKLIAKDLTIPDKFLEYKKIPAAWIIEQASLKGKTIGGAKVSEQHANHLINYQQATADDLVQLISLIKTKVRDEFGVQLEEEIRYLGF